MSGLAEVKVKARPVVVAVVAGGLMLAACEGGGSGDDGSTAGGQSSGGLRGLSLDPDRRAPAPPVEGAVAGGTVTVLAETEPFTLDPTGAYGTLNGSNAVLTDLVTRSLTQYVYLPARDATVLVPDLATDLGTSNEDFTEWTFTIRDGVRFEDGTEVTAEDVAFGIKRSFDKAFEGPRYSNDYFLDGDSYDGPYEDGTSYPGVVVDGDTLTIKMERPFPDMPYWGTYPAMGPIPEQGSDPPGYGLHPLATGPYKIASYAPHKSVTLVRNDQWDPDTDPGRHAYPDRYVFRFNQPVERIDATILGDSKPAQTMVSATLLLAGSFEKASRLDRVTVGTGSGGCTFGYLLDSAIDEIEVRQAIGYAYPYEGLLKVLGGIPGVTIWVGESNLLPPGFPARHSYRVLDTDPGHSDLAKATALLKASGYAPGEYELAWPYVTSDPNFVQTTERMVEAFEATGFRARPHPVDSYDELNELSYDPDAPINMRWLGWCQDWPSGISWFQPLFHSDSKDNATGFSEPAVDAEIERIAALPLDEQSAEWAALDETLMTDYYPAVITHYNAVSTLQGSRIDGVHIDVQGTPNYKDVHIIP